MNCWAVLPFWLIGKIGKLYYTNVVQRQKLVNPFWKWLQREWKTQKQMTWEMREATEQGPLAVWAESAERCQYYGEKRVGFGSNHPKLGFIIEQKWYNREKYVCSYLSNIIQNVHTAKWMPFQLVGYAHFLASLWNIDFFWQVWPHEIL